MITIIVIFIFIMIKIIIIIITIMIKYEICTWDGCETSALVMLAILCNGEPELLSSIFGDCKYCVGDAEYIISLFDPNTIACKVC